MRSWGMRQMMSDPDPVLSAEEARQARTAKLRRFLEDEVWPNIPPEIRGKRLAKEEEEEILGFGPDGC